MPELVECDWREIAAAICDREGINRQTLARVDSSDHVVFFAGDDLVLKIFRPVRRCFDRELRALEFVTDRIRFTTPAVRSAGSLDGHDYIVISRIRGGQLNRSEFLALDRADQIAILTDLGNGLKELHDCEPVGFVSDWAAFVEGQAATFIERQIEHGVNQRIINQLPKFIEESLPPVPLKPTSFLHGDVHLGNLRFDSTPAISGLFDFADSRIGWCEYDLLAIGVLIVQGERELQRELFRAYGYADAQMDEEMRRRLMMLTMLYETSDLRRYAMRLRPDAVDLDLYELERAMWNFV